MLIHQYVSNGYQIVLDVNSGSVHVVDELTYRVIPLVEEALAQRLTTVEALTAYVAERLSEEEDSADLQEVVGELLELKEAGMLFTEDIYENYIGAFQNRETVVKAL